MRRDRREFLLRSGMGISSLLLAHSLPGLLWSSLARAEERAAGENQFFVLINLPGGLDATLGLDPQVLAPCADSQDLFLEYRPDDILAQGGIRLAPGARALLPYAADACILNGVMMRRDAGHTVLNAYIQSGDPSGKTAALPIELAASQGSAPSGVVVNNSVGVASRDILLTDTGSILNVSQADPAAFALLAALRKRRATTLDRAQDSLLAGKVLDAQIKQVLDGWKSEEGELKAHHAVAAAFVAGASRQAYLNLSVPGTVDTHSDHEGRHLQSQSNYWEQVAEIFRTFKKIEFGSKSLFDNTTFMVVTEFSRTPSLNPAKGKDHNPFTNSVLLAGRGVQGGKMIGASRLIPRAELESGVSIHTAMPIRYATGEVAHTAKDASFIFPENIAKTVAQIFGNPADFAPALASAQPVPGVAKG